MAKRKQSFGGLRVVGQAPSHLSATILNVGLYSYQSPFHKMPREYYAYSSQ